MSVGLQQRGGRPETWLSAVWGLICRLAIAFAAGYVLYRVSLIIVVVLVAAMLSFTMSPVVDWLQRSRLLRAVPRAARRNVAAVVVFVAVALALLQVAALVVRPMAAEISAFARNWKDYQAQWGTNAARFQTWYATLPSDVRQWIESQEFRDVGARAGEQLQQLARHTVESGMFLVELILIPVLAFSFLTESRPLKREFVSLLPRSRVRDGLYVLRQTGAILQSYAIGQLILALIAAAVVWLLMVSMGLRYPMAMAVLAGVTRVIPVVGPVVGAIPIVALTAFQGLDRAFWVLVAFTVMHLVESKLVMPRLIGYRIKLHPAVVIIVLLVGAEFFGMWGMFLAAPVAAVVKVLLEHFLVRPRRKPVAGSTRAASPV